MINIEEIKNYISEDALDSLFKAREEELFSRKEVSKQIEEIKKEKTMSYTNFEQIIINLPPHFRHCREEILNALGEYADREGLIQSFDNERFYKIGFCDGIKMMLDVNKNR